MVVTFTNTGTAGLRVNATAGAKQPKAAAKASPFEVCTLSAAALNGLAPAGNCTQTDTTGASSAVGAWSAAKITSFTSTTVTVALPAGYADAMEAGGALGGKMVVRYAWSAVPFEYKDAAVYAKAEGLPAGPFIMLVN